MVTGQENSRRGPEELRIFSGMCRINKTTGHLGEMCSQSCNSHGSFPKVEKKKKEKKWASPEGPEKRQIPKTRPALLSENLQRCV